MVRQACTTPGGILRQLGSKRLLRKALKYAVPAMLQCASEHGMHARACSQHAARRVKCFILLTADLPHLISSAGAPAWAHQQASGSWPQAALSTEASTSSQDPE